MQQVSLPVSLKGTSALGFGSGFLSAQLEMPRSLRLVQAALDAGIRHFDTAPLYGLGHAEDVLGRALWRRRSECTIATKVGLARPSNSLLRSLMRVGSYPLRRAIRRIRPASVAPAGGTQDRTGTVFKSEFVRASLADSLRRLRTSQVELLLLHEVQLCDLNDELLTTLEDRRRLGDVAALGLATEPTDIQAIVRAYPGVFDVAQHHWSVLDARAPPPTPSSFRITHRALMRAFASMKHWLLREAGARMRLSEAIGMDLHDAERLAELLIAAALNHNAGGIVLVASHSHARITQNARIADDSAAIATGGRFIELLLQESGCPFIADPKPSHSAVHS